MRELIDELFAPALANPHLDTRADAVPVPVPEGLDLVVTTDGFTVRPLEFPGGNIGSLAVHGTVNDLAVSGAEPRFITLSVFLEEGLEIGLAAPGDRRAGSGGARQRRRGGRRRYQGRGPGRVRRDLPGRHRDRLPAARHLSCARSRARRRSHSSERPDRRAWRGGHARAPGIRSARRSAIGRGQRAARRRRC